MRSTFPAGCYKNHVMNNRKHHREVEGVGEGRNNFIRKKVVEVPAPVCSRW